METNLIDLIFIFTVVVSGSLALYQGFFKELLALFGWVIAFVNIKIFFSSISNLLKTIIENDLKMRVAKPLFLQRDSNIPTS